ncbi:MAG: hypothetical protein WA850_15635 [Xanthobacteraceae bacterium]
MMEVPEEKRHANMKWSDAEGRSWRRGKNKRGGGRKDDRGADLSHDQPPKYWSEPPKTDWLLLD